MASVALCTGHILRIHCLSIVLTIVNYQALLYYDYALTLDCERRLFWSRQGLKQWGSLLFFLNRYCGVLGHAPVIIQTFAPPGSVMYPLCPHLQFYHQILAIIMQTIIGCTSLHCQHTAHSQLNPNALPGSHIHR